MENVIITVNSEKRTIVVKPKKIAISGENMQGQFIVEFADNFIDGEARLDVLICSCKKRGYIALTKNENTYTGDILSSITRYAGKVKMQVVIKQTAISGATPIFKSEIFEVIIEDSINATEVLTDK